MEPRIARRRLEDERAKHAFRFAREDDNVGLPSAILASGASNGTQDRAPTIGGTRERNTLFVSRERTTTSDFQARSSRAGRAMEPRIARRRLEDERAKHAFRFAREDDNVGLPSAILASGASNGHCAISDQRAAYGRRHSQPRTVEYHSRQRVRSEHGRGSNARSGRSARG
jgi:hypothetical protein